MAPRQDARIASAYALAFETGLLKEAIRQGLPTEQITEREADAWERTLNRETVDLPRIRWLFWMQVAENWNGMGQFERALGALDLCERELSASSDMNKRAGLLLARRYVQHRLDKG